MSSHVTVVPKEESRVIRIDVNSENPRKATQISNTIAELYLVDQLEAKFDATRRARSRSQGRASMRLSSGRWNIWKLWFHNRV